MTSAVLEGLSDALGFINWNLCVPTALKQLELCCASLEVSSE